MAKSSLWKLLLAMGIIALALTGLCGCGSDETIVNPGPGTIPGTGAVSGTVVYFNTGAGLGGIEVTIGGRTAVTDSNGRFTVINIPPGVNQQITVAPPYWLALPTVEPIRTSVFADQTTALSAPIVLIDAGSQPPGPWS